MVRKAGIEDLESIVAIYNQAVAAGFQTADTEPLYVEQQGSWLESHSNPLHPVIVAEFEGYVAGWLSVSAYRPGRNALKDCVEISFYVQKDLAGRGIGSSLIEHGLRLCRELGHYSILTIILEPNSRSISLVKKFGFEQWAYLPDVANFGGPRCSHVYYGLHLI